MDTNFFVYLLGRRWPMMLVVLAGIVFAVISWKRHPRVSAFAIAGLVLFQIQSLAFSSMYYKLPELANHGWTWAAIDNLSIAIDVCHDIFYASAIALLAAAVFSRRNLQPGSQSTLLDHT